MAIVGSGTRIIARDVKKLAAFYQSVVGLRLVVAGDDYALFDDGAGTLIEIEASSRTSGEESTSRVGLNLFVDSLDELALDRPALGVSQIADHGYRRDATAADPEGNAILFVERAVDISHKGGADDDPSRRPLLDHLGVRWSLTDLETFVELDLREDLRGPGGALQGGVTATLIDVAAATTANIALQGARVFTTSMTIHYLRQGRIGPIRATARLIRSSRLGAVVEVQVVDVDDGEAIAVALLQMQIREPPPPDPRSSLRAN